MVPIDISIRDYNEELFLLPNAAINYPGQGTVYLVYPKKIGTNMKLPVVIAVHGSGRSAIDYRENSFYRAQRNIVLQNGYMFISISNGLDCFGLDDGLYNLNLLFDFLQKYYYVNNKAVLWATSAGGVLAARMIRNYPEKVDFVVGTFPVFDLLSVFHLQSCRKAWAISKWDEFEKHVASINPIFYTDALKNHLFYIAHGDADAAVPIEKNSQRIKHDLDDNVFLEIVKNGEHTTRNFNYYNKAVYKAFHENPGIQLY